MVVRFKNNVKQILSILISSFAMILIFNKCSKSKWENGKYTLKAGGCTTGNVNHYKVCFQKLITESRCPEGAMCVWQGYAQAEFLFTDGQQSITFNLATIDGRELRKDTIINNIKVSLIDIIPYPAIHNPSPSPVKAIIEIK
jgi:hypothetical protein